MTHRHGSAPLQHQELVIVLGAGHADLYDRVNLSPFDTLTTFFQNTLR